MERERTAAAGLAFDANEAAMTAHDVIDDGEPEPGALRTGTGVGLDAVELAEDLALQPRGNPNAPVRDPDPGDLVKLLRDERIAGLQLPATALADPDGIARMEPLLAEAERADKPVLVHPGPAPPGPAGLPAWWPALAPYVAQQHQAWLAWHIAGRRRHPRLRIAFVALAGLAPLHHERLAARGGALGPLDPYVYYETSSYGTRAIDALIRVVGVDPIVHGSDRPYAQPVDPGLGSAFTHALFTANPRHLLTGEPR